MNPALVFPFGTVGGHAGRAVIVPTAAWAARPIEKGAPEDRGHIYGVAVACSRPSSASPFFE